MWRQSNAQRTGLVNRNCPAGSRRLRFAEFFSRCASVKRHGVESLDRAADHNNHRSDWAPEDHPASDLMLLHRGPGFVPYCAGCEWPRGGQSGVPSDQSDPAGCRSRSPHRHVRRRVVSAALRWKLRLPRCHHRPMQLAGRRRRGSRCVPHCVIRSWRGLLDRRDGNGSAVAGPRPVRVPRTVRRLWPRLLTRDGRRRAWARAHLPR